MFDAHGTENAAGAGRQLSAIPIAAKHRMITTRAVLPRACRQIASAPSPATTATASTATTHARTGTRSAVQPGTMVASSIHGPGTEGPQKKFHCMVGPIETI